MRAGAPDRAGPGVHPLQGFHGRSGDPRVDSGPVSHHLPRLTAFPAAILLVLVLAAPVFADAALVEANPDDKAILATPPTVVTLRFSQGVDAGKSSFRLVGPDGEVGVGRPAKDGGKVMTLGDLTLGPGGYTVKWTVGSQDGHLVRGKLAFTVLDPTPAPATPSPGAVPTATPSDVPDASATPATPLTTPAVASTAPAVEPQASAADPATDETPASASATDVLIPIVVGLLLVGGVGVIVLRRSRGT
jgi:methionine-rich copper-binding protein CopC